MNVQLDCSKAEYHQAHEYTTHAHAHTLAEHTAHIFVC